MNKLIKLEMKKMKFGGFLRNAIIADIIIALWCILSKGGHEEGYVDYIIAFSDIGTYVRVTFIIFSAVLMAKMVIDEYRNKTITVLFSYPIERRKLMLAKIIPITVLTLTATIVSNIVIGAVFLGLDYIFHFVPQTLSQEIVIRELLRIVIYSVSAMGASMISIFFGMIKKSGSAAIVASFIISQLHMAVMNGSRIYNNFLLAILAALVWIAIGIMASNLSIRKVDIEDIA